MAEIEYNIFNIDAGNLSRFYSVNDDDLKSILQEVEIPNTFIPYEDFIELSYFTLDNTRLSTIVNYDRYSIYSGDTADTSAGNSEIYIDPVEDYKRYNDDTSEVKALYHFLRDSFLTPNIESTFTVESISPDKKEARIIPQNLNAFDVEKSKMHVSITIDNQTLTDFKPSQWSLHWNQIIGKVIPETLPEGIDFTWINGNSYFKLNFGDNWALKAGEKLHFNAVSYTHLTLPTTPYV